MPKISRDHQCMVVTCDKVKVPVCQTIVFMFSGNVLDTLEHLELILLPKLPRTFISSYFNLHF